MPKKSLVLLYYTAAITLFFALSQLPAQQASSGFLKVKARPGRAAVFVDGKYLGPAANFRMARKYNVAAGEHELALRDPRFEGFKTTVKIEAGKTTTIHEALTPRPQATPPFGKIKLKGFPKYSPLFVDGGYMGHADEFDGPNQALLVSPRDYTVKVFSPDGNLLLEQKVAIHQDKEVVLKAK